VVPSTDTIRYQWLVQNFVVHGLHALLAGPTGTGKTIYIKRKLALGGGLDERVWTSVLLNFSAQTSANQTQVGEWGCRKAAARGGSGGAGPLPAGRPQIPVSCFSSRILNVGLETWL